MRAVILTALVLMGGAICSLLLILSIHSSASNRHSADVRKFSLVIEQILPGGNAVARGIFYNLPPSESTEPEKLEESESNATQVRKIYLMGLPNGIDAGQNWTGWLAWKGSKTYIASAGSFETLPAYLISEAPSPLKPREGLRPKSEDSDDPIVFFEGER